MLKKFVLAALSLVFLASAQPASAQTTYVEAPLANNPYTQGGSPYPVIEGYSNQPYLMNRPNYQGQPFNNGSGYSPLYQQPYQGYPQPAYQQGYYQPYQGYPQQGYYQPYQQSYSPYPYYYNNSSNGLAGSLPFQLLRSIIGR